MQLNLPSEQRLGPRERRRHKLSVLPSYLPVSWNIKCLRKKEELSLLLDLVWSLAVPASLDRHQQPWCVPAAKLLIWTVSNTEMQLLLSYMTGTDWVGQVECSSNRGCLGKVLILHKQWWWLTNILFQSAAIWSLEYCELSWTIQAKLLKTGSGCALEFLDCRWALVLQVHLSLRWIAETPCKLNYVGFFFFF